MASKTANTCDHAQLLSKVSWIIEKTSVLDITDDDTLFQFPGKRFLCIAVGNDDPCLMTYYGNQVKKCQSLS